MSNLAQAIHILSAQTLYSFVNPFGIGDLTLQSPFECVPKRGVVKILLGFTFW